jgi:hypothetical protein
VLELKVDCRAPVQRQRLHLLLIGVDVKAGGEARFEDEVARSIGAELRDRELKLYETKAFQRVAFYGPLVNDVSPDLVRNQLAMIKSKIDELYRANENASQPQNDVVMIYLQGGKLIHVDPDFFVTTRSLKHPLVVRAIRDLDQRRLQSVAVYSRTLADFLTHTAGAHVLMLDVTGEAGTEQNARWPVDSRAAMLRYTWLKSPESPQQRLLSRLKESIGPPGTLAQLDARIADFYRQLAAQYPESIRFTDQVPASLQNLLLGER